MATPAIGNNIDRYAGHGVGRSWDRSLGHERAANWQAAGDASSSAAVSMTRVVIEQPVRPNDVGLARRS